MKIKPECATCIVRQIVDVSIETTNNENKQFELIKKCLPIIEKEYHNNAVPAWMGTVVHRYFKKISNCNDPYKRLKIIADETAKQYIEIVKENMDNSNNKLEKLRKCILGTIAGNSIDFGPFSTMENIAPLINSTINGNLAIDHTEDLLNDLENQNIKNILYICDNAGEIVFDKLLINEIATYNKNITIAVKGEPILNDATMEDVKLLNLDKEYNVITTGTDAIGIIFKECSEEFLNIFNSCDLIIAKGMGNFESLTEYNLNNKKLYYILKAKCIPVAEYNGVNLKDNIMLSNLKLNE